MTQYDIVGIVGTDHHPFERMLDWVAQAAAEFPRSPVLVQRGTVGERDGLDTVDYLTPEDLDKVIAGASAVICHGGPGTISTVRRAGHLPLVIPRDPRLGEHVDDHQLRFCEATAEAGRIVLVRSVEQLRDSIRLCLSGAAPVVSDDHDPRAAALRLGSLIQDLVAEHTPPRPWRQRILIRRALH